MLCPWPATQHQFLNRRFQENNAAFMESLQNFAALLEAGKYWQQSQLIGLMIGHGYWVAMKGEKRCLVLLYIEEDL